ncbi:MAG: hypothetical protein HYX87_03385 [Chloroflexi bacterium]|nr:hypothetical protein [Chloroflexota bacterium]
MRRISILIVAVILALTVVLGACAQSKPAPVSVADFYKNNTATIVVSYEPGGGNDYGARTFASFWSDVTGGSMIVKNITGGGGTQGKNTVFKAKPDGLTLGIDDLPVMLFGQVFKEPGVEYTMDKYTWLGGFASSTNALALSSKLPYKSMKELQGVEGLKFGADTPTATQGLMGSLTAELFKLKNARMVAGYGGTSKSGLALGRGEIDYLTAEMSAVQDLINKKFAREQPLMVFSQERSPLYPDVPTIAELLPKVSPQDQQLLDFMFATSAVKVIFAPPGLPADKVTYLRDAFSKIVAMDGFVKTAKLRWSDWPKPLTSDNVIARVGKVTGLPPEVVTNMLKLVDGYAQK